MEENLELALAWLGLDQYYERFMHAGFDSWETLLEITEGDLEVLDVELGHRRKLQKEIHKSGAREAAAVSQTLPTRQTQGTQQQMPVSISPDVSSSSLTTEPDSTAKNPKVPTKRSYRHHPKPDPRAPKRPYSAYVLFSNHIRALLAPDSLDFPEISRQVGQRWQALSAEEKESWTERAQGPRNRYKEEVMRYRGTAEYAEHQQYLDDFQAKHGSRIRQDSSVGRGPNQSSPNKKGSANVYPTPGPTSAGTDKTVGESVELMASVEAPHLVSSGVATPRTPADKTAIRRLRRDSTNEVMEGGERRTKSKQACEPCRQKKTKCNEERPTCRHCSGLKIECYYSSEKESKEKRRFTELSKKLDACQKLLVQMKPRLPSTEQNLVQQALDMPPRTTARQSSTQQMANMDARPQSLDDTDSTSDETPGLGLMEATCHVNNDDYAPEGMGIQPGAFAGQSSDVQWMRRLTNELDQEGSGRRQSQHPFPLSVQPNIFAEDNESAVVGNNVDPFQVPIKATADALIEGYFRTVHASFPILHRPLFMQQYNKSQLIWHKPINFEDRMFLTTLQIVFAIGAVHARLSGSIEVSDDRDHMLYFARARMLAVDSGVFNDQVHLGQAQVFGLGAMYCLVTDQMNRAWIASGLAIRSAQSLGLHLHNITPSVSKVEKEYRSRIWFSLLSFERTLGVMSGRPSMVQNRDYNLTLPPPETADLASPSSLSEGSCGPSSSKEGDMNSQTSRAFQHSISESSRLAFPNGKRLHRSQSLLEATYFRYHVELSGLAHEAVSQLYSPAIRQYRWSKIQALIDDYDDHLTTWKTSLEPPFDGLTHDFISAPDRSPLSIALSIQFFCVRAIVNRPCLYRRERTALRQPSHTAVSRCIGSARAVIELVSTSPTADLIHQGPKWWLLLHHTKRALTVVLLELAFRAEHMPSEAEELLAEAKKALTWLREMAQTSKIAEHTWKTMSCLLVKAARRVGMDAGDCVFSDGHSEQTESWPQHPNQDTMRSNQNPIPAMDSLQPSGPSLMNFGMPADSAAFGNSLPHQFDQFKQNQDPMTYQNFVELEAFDQFSFEPMTTGRGDLRSSFVQHQPEVGGGQLPHPSSISAMPNGHYPSMMLQLQNHQQQHFQRGSAIRAEDNIMDDWFRFDPGRDS